MICPQTAYDSWLFEFQDTISKIEISADLSITHPDYELWTVPVAHQEYLQQISAVERDRYLSAKLKNYLYDVYINKLKPKPKSTQLQESNQSDSSQMTNYVDKWSKTKFYLQLLEHNHGQGYSDPGWSVVSSTGELWQINKNGLTLHIKPDEHLVEPRELQIGQTVSIKMPPNTVDHGFYIAVGNAGNPNAANATVAQLYFNVNSEGILPLLDFFTQHLNDLAIPFNFKIAYEETDFARLDAAVLEFNRADYEQLYPLLQQVWQENQNYFQVKVPFFCKSLASGVGLAEKPPINTEGESENIGQRHCNLIAQALVEATKNRQIDKLKYVLNYLSPKIKLEFLYLNLDAQDIYQVI